MEVGQEDRRPAAVDGGRAPVDDAQDPLGGDDGPQDHQRRGRDDAAAAPAVEAEERGPTADGRSRSSSPVMTNPR